MTKTTRTGLNRLEAFLSEGTIWTSIHFVLTFFWMAMVPAMIYFEWWKMVEFLAVISVYANVVGHWSAWQAARSEEQQEEGGLNTGNR